MVNSSYSWKIVQYFSFIVLIMSAYYSYEIYQAAEKKVIYQQNITRNVSQVKQTWNALQPSIEKWNKIFLHHDSVTDLVSLNDNLRLKPTRFRVHEDTLIEGSSSAVIFEGNDIGLAQRCIRNSSNGYHLSAETVRGTIDGLKIIDNRADLNWHKVSITAESGVFNVIYTELCSRYRVEG